MSTNDAWSRLRAIFRREKAELDDAIAHATERGNATLDAREREQAATPEERMKLEQERAAAADDDFEAIRRKIEGGS
jgi:hypothetical protein